MGCDIHLHIEVKSKRYKDTNWDSPSFKGEFSDRIYGMFAYLGNVRNYKEIVPIVPNRGIPEDLNWRTFDSYYRKIVDNEECNYEEEISSSEVESYLKLGFSGIIERNEIRFFPYPDWHSPNWCTSEEFKQCYNKVFRDEYGNNHGCYIEWLALLSYISILEEEYEVRCVYWFDN